MSGSLSIKVRLFPVINPATERAIAAEALDVTQVSSPPDTPKAVIFPLPLITLFNPIFSYIFITISSPCHLEK